MNLNFCCGFHFMSEKMLSTPRILRPSLPCVERSCQWRWCKTTIHPSYNDQVQHYNVPLQKKHCLKMDPWACQRVLQWPPQLLNLNPIEHYYGVIELHKSAKFTWCNYVNMDQNLVPFTKIFFTKLWNYWVQRGVLLHISMLFLLKLLK